MAAFASAELWDEYWKAGLSEVAAKDWEAEVLRLDADELRSHLKRWELSRVTRSQTTGFDSVVEILHEAGIDGQALVFYREERTAALLEIRSLGNGRIPSSALAQFLGILEKYPRRP